MKFIVNPEHCRTGWIVGLLACLLWSDPVLSQGLETDPPATDAGREVVRFAFTRTTLGSINENDATAAIGIWTRRLVKELDMAVIPEVNFYSDRMSLQKGIESENLDIIYMTTPQWYDLRNLIDNEAFLAIEQAGSITERYILLVHKDGPINAIEDLKGTTLRMLINARASLAPAWFHLFLAEHKLNKTMFKDITRVKKLNTAILPVFFKQADACLVTRSGFETMAELNPQMLQRLKTVAVSPPFITTVFGFRRGYQSKIKQVILNDIQKMAQSSSGAQLLTIFQMGGIRQAGIKELRSAASLLKAYEQFSGPDHNAENP